MRVFGLALFLLSATVSPALAQNAPPAAGVAPAEVGPGHHRTLIQAEVRRHLHEIRACYAKELAGRPALMGTIRVRFFIGADGAVHSAIALADDLGVPSLSACVLAAVRRWVFPPPPSGGVVQVVYPFVFRPDEGSDSPPPHDRCPARD